VALRPYNAFAGNSLERLSALSDGVFAVVMTLLVLDLRTPAAEGIRTEADLAHALLALAPRLGVYLMSFLTLGIFWVGQQTQLSNLARANRDLAWLHITFLFTVTLVPFSTSLMAEFITYRTALLLYWGNILLLGVAVLAMWRYARFAGLVRDEASIELACAVERRVFVAQGLYAFGAALCVINTYWSLAFIVLVQLNYAIAPRLPLLWRL
jgi:uncharacterized membrane protein